MHARRDTPAHAGADGWQRFWAAGRWWKALLAAVVYLVLYSAFSALVVGPLWGDRISPSIFGDAESVLFGLIVPIAFGAVLLVAFIWSLGWFGAIFGRQPIRGRWWMWIVVAVLLVPIALRLLGIDYASFRPEVIALTFVAGLLIGFAEEVLTRGIAVRILRDAGHREVVVAIVSSLLFGLLHSVNALTGQPALTVILTMAFAFGFGVLMYVVLRVTGSIWWPILIHGLTDPTTFLGSGGIDVADAGHQNVLLTLAGPFNILFVVLAVVSLLLIRGRVRDRRVEANGLRTPDGAIVGDR